MLAIFITDVTRLVTRGFLASTGGVLLLIGVLGVAGQYFLPDPSHLTEHFVNRAWLQPALGLAALFMILFLLYLVAVYLRPPVLHVIIGLVATSAGLRSRRCGSRWRRRPRARVRSGGSPRRASRSSSRRSARSTRLTALRRHS